VLQAILTWVVERLIARAKRNPYFHLAGYMNRWWLIPYNRFTPAVRVHEILRSDDDRAFHDHPWAYLTMILKGGYWEVTPVFESGIYKGDKRTWYGPGSVLFRRATNWHRLELPEGQTATTLFTTFKYQQRWGFMPQPERNKVDYREYLDPSQVNPGDSAAVFDKRPRGVPEADAPQALEDLALLVKLCDRMADEGAGSMYHADTLAQRNAVVRRLRAHLSTRGVAIVTAGVTGADRAQRLKVLYAAMDYATQCAMHPHAAGGEVAEKDEAFDKLRGLLDLLPPDGVGGKHGD
jgi:hypothetical protein